ncbi:hypothetical protein [Gandjariella thermophila]|uniref:Uncharacterized protein n=1 Tax=Gandjariella thermophila TaxID=1931992 RepID=A0A4D4JGN4_9PSEU|nr:hypothetical protein [Gandjariella thermophila]GDY33057.1 hypothetical protein GTS_46900 [Gandjariella thermophila]
MTYHRLLVHAIADSVALAAGIGLAWVIHLVFPHHCPWRISQRARLRRWFRRRHRAGRD